MPIQRGYATGKFNVELDGMNAGWIWSADGGQATSDVVLEKVGSDIYQHKHLSTVKYEDINVQIATGMSKSFWTWVERSFQLDHQRKDGAIVASNFDLKETSRLSFYNALVSEVSFPALDAASKDAARVGVKIVPEYTRMVTKAQGGDAVQGTENRSIQRKWMPANFRLRIDGVDCKRVNKIEALTIKQKISQYAVGEMRDYENEPTTIEVPNLVISMAESHSKDLWDWHKSFVIDGKNSQEHEKTATLEFLTPNLKTVLVTLTFYNLGIFKIIPDKLDASAEGIRRVKAEMYCEKINFKFEAGSTWE